jgi:hypothetical protein
MTNKEAGWIEKQIKSSGAIPFLTEGSDIEYYFIESHHLGELLNVEAGEIDDWKNEVAQGNHNELVHKYTRKRDEAKSLYKNKQEDPPDTFDMIGEDMPLPEEKRLGKYMLKKIRKRPVMAA